MISMGKTSTCHKKIRYISEKSSMSYKNSISMGKTIDVIEKYDINGKKSRCHIQIRYIWGKQVDII